MQNLNRPAYTMIELVFVIVIMGILAALALPRLTATRNDAKISKEMMSAATEISNLGIEYAAQGAFINHTVAQANLSLNCFTITDLGADGNITLSVIAAVTPRCPIKVLEGVRNKSQAVGLTNFAGATKTYSFGANSVKY